MEITKARLITNVKALYSKNGFIIDEPTGRGVVQDFRIKKGLTKRDPVEIFQVVSNNIKLNVDKNNLSSEKKYIFYLEGKYHITNGKNILNKINSNGTISKSQIEKFKELPINDKLDPTNPRQKNTPVSDLPPVEENISEKDDSAVDQKSALNQETPAEPIGAEDDIDLMNMAGETQVEDPDPTINFGTRWTFKWINKKRNEGYFYPILEKHPLNKPQTLRDKEGKKEVNYVERQKKILSDYRKLNMIPFFAGGSNQLVPVREVDEYSVKHPKTKIWVKIPSLISLKKLKSVQAISEKKLTKADIPQSLNLKPSEAESTTGKKIQARMKPKSKLAVNSDTAMFNGHFTQKDGGGSQYNVFPTIYYTNHMIFDNDEIGHMIAFLNNMYSRIGKTASNPFHGAEFYTRVQGKVLKAEIDPIKVNRGLAQNMLNSLGFEQNKILLDLMTEGIFGVDHGFKKAEANSKILSFRKPDGGTDDFKISDQALVLMDLIIPDSATILCHTTSNGIIKFDWDLDEKPIDEDITGATLIWVEGSPEDEVSEMLNSDDLLKIVSQRYNINPIQVQTMAEALYNRGWITYPRTDLKKAQQEGIGIELLKDISTFTGSQNELRILQVIQKYQTGGKFTAKGHYELTIAEETFSSEGMNKFGDQPEFLRDDQFDLRVLKNGVEEQDLIDQMRNRDIGTPATRTIMLNNMINAGFITVSQMDTARIYTSDERGFYLKGAYSYLAQRNAFPFNLVQQIGSANSIPEFIQILDQYNDVNGSDFKMKVMENVKTLLEVQKDILEVEAL